MEQELDNFYNSYKKSIEEKHKLLIDFESSINSNVETARILSTFDVIPLFKIKKEQQRLGIKTEIIDLKNKSKNKLF